ncbi:MAG: methylated-DNA--[protein]-cysteine S-methyltransferase [Anaerolineae bacterium]|nr:methylated-DNA--[protein]-cysteine S-methyltransferase [Anaerolineae bacterium]
MPDFYGQVYALVRAIPPGQVLNYGAVAAWLGQPRAARAVGYALNRLPPGSDIPWHRVVGKRGSQGKISLRAFQYSVEEQIARLRAEGVVFDAEAQFPLDRYLWQPDPAEVAHLLKTTSEADAAPPSPPTATNHSSDG